MQLYPSPPDFLFFLPTLRPSKNLKIFLISGITQLFWGNQSQLLTTFEIPEINKSDSINQMMSGCNNHFK